MDKLKLSIFDTFAILIPGVLIIVSIFSISSDVERFSEIQKEFEDVSNSGLILGLLISYIIGIMCNYLGEKLYKIAKFIWKKKVLEYQKGSFSFSLKHVLIREYSPNNYAYLENWLGLSNMCHNIAVVLLIFSFISIWKIIQTSILIEWSIIFIICFWSSIVFLRRSISFNNFYKSERIATMEMLFNNGKIDGKVDKIIEESN